MKALRATFLCHLIIYLIVKTHSQQNEYRIKIEYGGTREVAKDFAEVSHKIFKYNRTTTCSNITFHTYFVGDETLILRIKALQFHNNEFRGGPIDFTLPLCPMLAKETGSVIDLTDIFQYSNLTECPLEPGIYVLNNVALDARKFPPGIPEGKYKLEVAFYLGKTYLGVIEWVLNVMYFIKY